MQELMEKRSEQEKQCEVITPEQGKMIERILQGQNVQGLTKEELDGDVSTEIVRTITTSMRSAEDEKAVGEIRVALNSAGINAAHLANVLREGLACRKHVQINGKTRKIPDYALRIKYLELAHKLRGDMSVKDQGNQDTTYEERLRAIMHKRPSLLTTT